MPSWCLVHVTPGLSPSVGQRVLWVEHRFWHRGPSWSSLVRLTFRGCGTRDRQGRGA